MQYEKFGLIFFNEFGYYFLLNLLILLFLAFFFCNVDCFWWRVHTVSFWFNLMAVAWHMLLVVGIRRTRKAQGVTERMTLFDSVIIIIFY